MASCSPALRPRRARRDSSSLILVLRNWGSGMLSSVGPNWMRSARGLIRAAYDAAIRVVTGSGISSGDLCNRSSNTLPCSRRSSTPK